VLWTFILKFLEAKGGDVDVGAWRRAKRAPASKRTEYSVTSLSPHEMSKWVRHMCVAVWHSYHAVNRRAVLIPCLVSRHRYAELKHRAKLFVTLLLLLLLLLLLRLCGPFTVPGLLCRRRLATGMPARKPTCASSSASVASWSSAEPVSAGSS